jgi:hypothetical protein
LNILKKENFLYKVANNPGLDIIDHADENDEMEFEFKFVESLLSTFSETFILSEQLIHLPRNILFSMRSR